MYTRDTIAAIATPLGKGGIGIIRISGNQAPSFTKSLFRPKTKRDSFVPGTMYFGDFTNHSGRVIDSGYYVWFKPPHSFTGEDIVEFHCHGGIVILQTMLKALYAQGVRPAEQGEFSKRAFLNGKMDLVQAESIADLINASSAKAAEIARSHYQGKLSSTIEDIRNGIAAIIAWMEAEIDYPEVDLDRSEQKGAEKALREQIVLLEKLINTYMEGKIYTEGIATVILGRPNVGKSSLLNILSGEDMAIVTDVPGTTRDVLEVPVAIRGIPLRLADTAGIRESLDKIEQIGIERARKQAAKADLTLLVLDSSQDLTGEDLLLLDTVDKQSTIVLLNKRDLPVQIDSKDLANRGFCHVQPISVLKDQGIEELRNTIEKMFTTGHLQEDTTFITNQRHSQSLINAAQVLERAVKNWSNLPQDLLAMDLREGWQILGEITGSVWTEDLLDCIFQRFCLGK